MRTAALVLYLLKHHQGPLDILRASVDIGGDVDSVAVLALRRKAYAKLMRSFSSSVLRLFASEFLEGQEDLASESPMACGL